MNERQKIALKSPVFQPVGLVDPKFRKIVHLGKIRICSILTISAPEKYWHASGSVLSPQNKPIPFFGNIPSEDFERLFTHLKNLLENVGTGELSTMKPDAVLHFFKTLSETELSQIKKSSAYGN